MLAGGERAQLPEIREARTRIVESTLLVMTLVACFVGLTLVALSPTARVRQFFLSMAVALVAWFTRSAVRRTGYRFAAWCFILIFLALFGAAAWTAGGLTAPAVHAFFVLVILAALLLGTKEGYLVAGIVALFFVEASEMVHVEHEHTQFTF